MSGHNKWSQIKQRKGAQDTKKSAVFSKILNAIIIAARPDPNPSTNPRLRAVVEKAKAANVPQDNITRALSRQQEKELYEFTLEAYGPEGIALIIQAITDSTNRTNNELRKILSDAGAKVADPGSVLWSFTFSEANQSFSPKFTQPATGVAKENLEKIIIAINEHPDVQAVIHNAE